MDLAAQQRQALEALPTPPALELASAWRTVHTFFTSKVKTAVELTLPQAKQFKTLQNEVVWVYGNPKPPTKLNAELEGAAFVLSARFPQSPVSALVASWVARGGLPFALQSIAQAFGTFTNVSHGDRYSTAGTLLVPSEQKPWLPLEVPIDAIFRAELARATDADRQSARAAALELRNQPFPAARSLLSCIFLEPEWIDADLEARVRTGKSMIVTPLSLLRAGDGAGVAKFFTVLTRLELESLTSPFAHALLERFPDAQPLAAWLRRTVQVLRDADQYDRYSSRATLDQLTAAAKPLAANEHVASAVVDALTTLQNEKFAKDDDPRPGFIDLLRAAPKISAPLVKQAAAKKAKWAITVAEQLARASESGAPAPREGTFWLPASFAPLHTLEGPLTASETQALERVFRRREPDALRALKMRCTSQSLAAFTWDLFQAWLASGSPSAGRWAILALGDFGDDETARKLTVLIRQWPGESAHQRAATGLEVLAAIGSDTALRMLDSIAQRVRYRALQDRARDLMHEIARRRGLTAAALGDRLIPDAGLEADGTRVLSFGARSFRISVDANLRPVVTTDAGKTLANLPTTPSAGDDPTLTARSVESWKEFKKLLKDEGAQLVLRFELAMADERRWTGRDFEALVLKHPLLVRLVRSLLWGTFDADRKLVEPFRVGPRQRPLTMSGDAFTIPGDALVGLVHPLVLSEDQAAVLSDAFTAEGDAPFEQLTRKVFTLGPKEWARDRLHRYEGRTASAARLRGLRERGWRLGPALDAGMVEWITRRIGDETIAALNIEGMNVVGELSQSRVHLGTIVFGDGLDDDDVFDPYDTSTRTVDTRSRVAISELLRDLDAIVDPAD